MAKSTALQSLEPCPVREFRMGLNGQIQEARRELAKRRSLYPRLVREGKMSTELQGDCLRRMESILETLERVHNTGFGDDPIPEGRAIVPAVQDALAL